MKNASLRTANNSTASKDSSNHESEAVKQTLVIGKSSENVYSFRYKNSLLKTLKQNISLTKSHRVKNC